MISLEIGAVLYTNLGMLLFYVWVWDDSRLLIDTFCMLYACSRTNCDPRKNLSPSEAVYYEQRRYIYVQKKKVYSV
jgi:hypothetical protein